MKNDSHKGLTLHGTSVYAFIGKIAAVPVEAGRMIEDYIRETDADNRTSPAGTTMGKELRDKADRVSRFAEALLPLLIDEIQESRSRKNQATVVGEVSLNVHQLEELMRRALAVSNPKAAALFDEQVPFVKADPDVRGFVSQELNRQGIGAEDVSVGRPLEGHEMAIFHDAHFAMNEIRQTFGDVHRLKGRAAPASDKSKSSIGKIVSANAVVTDEGPPTEKMRQGILIGFTETGNPIILGLSGTPYRGVEQDFTVVADENLLGPTKSFVEKWRAEQRSRGRSNPGQRGGHS
jgi:hypothetical protein